MLELQTEIEIFSCVAREAHIHGVRCLCANFILKREIDRLICRLLYSLDLFDCLLNRVIIEKCFVETESHGHCQIVRIYLLRQCKRPQSYVLTRTLRHILRTEFVFEIRRFLDFKYKCRSWLNKQTKRSVWVSSYISFEKLHQDDLVIANILTIGCGNGYDVCS
jgi:hypothetical protein